MRKSAIAVVAFIVIILVAVVFFPLKPGGIPPIIQDQPEIGDQVELNVGTSLVDEPNLADSTVFSNQSGYDFYIDENGTKHYTIQVVDKPDIEG